MKFRILVSAITAVMLVINQFFAYPILADEYEISGNGEGSSNSVNVEEKKSDSVSQSNDAEVKNEVKPEVETGDNKQSFSSNKASGNSGPTDVKTGDASSQTEVVNSGNQNSVSGGCCPSNNDSSAKITDNGSDSNNQINSKSNSDAAISQNSGAKITNNIQINANAGDNEAINNGGDVTIKTGSVNIGVGVYNKTNSSYIAYAKANPIFDLKVSGNGSGSANEVENEADFNEKFLVNNYLELKNNVGAKANTGENRTKGNKGKVVISTGSVLLDIILKNEVNKSVIVADCGCKSPTPSPTPTPTPKPSESPSPSSPPSGGGNGGSSGGGSSGGGSSSSGSSSSSSGGQVLGATLPATGGFSILSLTILALSLLILGIILRIDYPKAKSYIQYFNFRVSAPAVIYILTFCTRLSLSRQADFARRRAFYFYPQDICLRPAY